MFEKVIDKKVLFIDGKENEILDLTESCFKDNINTDINYTLIKFQCTHLFHI